MKIFEKYQFYFTYILATLILIIYLFEKPLSGEYYFGGPDSLSPSAIHQGIQESNKDYGEYAFWIPWVFSGLPSVHSFQNISDYYLPNHIINFFKNLGLVAFWNYVFHFLLMGLGIIFLLKQFNLTSHSIFFGSISFILMPYLVTMVVHGHGSQMMSVSWLPWIICYILKLYKENSIINIGMLAFVVGLQLQRAHVQIAYYTWLSSGLLICYILIRYNFYNKLRFFISSILAFIIGLLMSFWIYLPVINYAPYSIRGGSIEGGTGFDYATAWSFSFYEVFTFFIPSYLGFGGMTYWGDMPFTDYPNYMGIVVFCASIIGIIFHKNNIKWYFTTLAIISLFLSFGKNFFLYQIFYDYFPYFNKFRVPAMFLILTQFSISILAAFGLDVIIKRIIEKRSLIKLSYYFISFIIIILISKFILLPDLGNFPKYPQTDLPQHIKLSIDNLRMTMINNDIVYSIAFLLIITFSLYLSKKKWINSQVIAIIIISLSTIDLIKVDTEIISPDKASLRQSTMITKSFKSNYLKEDEIIKFLKSDTTKYRILPLGYLNNNRWSAFQIESIDGYHPAKIYNYNLVKNNVGWQSLGLLRMLNVKYLVTISELNHSAFEKVFQGKLFHQGKYIDVNIYKFKYFLQRLFFIEKLEYLDDTDAQISFLNNDNFDPINKSFTNIKKRASIYKTNGFLKLKKWSPNKIVFNINTEQNHFLGISEVYYPRGWILESHPEWEIYELNKIIRGIDIPPGNHEITMTFQPNDLKYGSMLTYLSLLIIFILVFAGKYKKLIKK